MSSQRPRIAPSLTPRDEPIEPLPPADEPAPEPRPRRRGARFWFKRIALWTFLLLFLLFLTPPAIVFAMRWQPPPTSAFMLRSEVQPVHYRWVPASQIPESMRKAVVAAEDQKFYTHWGFDFIAIAEALEHNEKSKRKRGASTITQQTAKNLFLWPSRSWLRKGLEVTFTLLLEGLWSKERILEVYLNIAEFGPGIYGVEAAAQKFFDKSAAEMTPLETARLTAVLPNPKKWQADRPGPYVQKRVDWILVHIGHAPHYSPFVVEEEPVEGVAPTAPEPPPGELPPEEGDAPEEDAPAEGPAPAEPTPAPPVESQEAPAPPAQAAPAEPAPTPAPETAPAQPPS